MTPDKPVVAVAGGSGFIGRAVREAMLKDGHTVMALDRPNAGEVPAVAVDVPCDVTWEQSVSEAVGRIGREAGAAVAS
jgi:NAD(P)-dependent dehydrogenase (short-subunit alcohol dehydrogenase family)